jgi:hypothetical protein
MMMMSYQQRSCICCGCVAVCRLTGNEAGRHFACSADLGLIWHPPLMYCWQDDAQAALNCLFVVLWDAHEVWQCSCQDHCLAGFQQTELSISSNEVLAT